MIAVYWPPAWLASIPVVLIEGFAGFRILRVNFGRVIVASAVANLFSTLLGIPLTWLALALIELLAFGSATWTPFQLPTVCIARKKSRFPFTKTTLFNAKSSDRRKH
jgi:hypothetical protein